MSFKACHPCVNFVYFVAVIGLSMFLNHPLCLSISIVLGLVNLWLLKGKRGAIRSFFITLPVMLISAIINPLVSHEGATVLTYLPGGNPLTLESIAFGFAAAVMLGSVILWFSSFNEIMTSDKLMHLFGKIMPTFALIFAMILRFVPRASQQFKLIVKSQQCFENDLLKKNFKVRIKRGTKAVSALMTWMLENSVETANSMKSRGFGTNQRTAFSNLKLTKRDVFLLICEFASGIYIIIGYLIGGLKCSYYPKISIAQPSMFSLSIFFVYIMLCLIPIFVELWGCYKWKFLK